LYVLKHAGDLDLVIRHISDDVVLPHPDPGHAGQVGQLVPVRIPDLREVVQVLVGLPEISVVYRVIRPSFPSGFCPY
jgi:hypothetical protein